jgi:hypothetical protein
VGCGGSQPPIGAPDAVPQSRTIATRDDGGPAQSCPYLECIALRFGSPFQQKWCVTKSRSYGWGADCVPIHEKFYWHGKVRSRNPHARKEIEVSFQPDLGNPTRLMVSERRKLKSSKGKIVYELFVKACVSAGCEGSAAVGISTE